MSDTDALAMVGAAAARMRSGDGEGAIATLEEVLRLDPRHVGAWVTLGSALVGMGRRAEAEACYRQALEIVAHEPVALRNLGVLLDAAGRHAESLALADEALAVEAGHGEALYARANALFGLGRLALAEDAYRLAAEQPELRFEALTKLGLTLAGLDRKTDAVACLDEAVALQPDAAVARLRRALVFLQHHDFGPGWVDYEARWGVETHLAQSAGVIPRTLVPQLATGAEPSHLIGRRILLLGEQGVGDQLMFASIIPDVSAVAASVTCVCDPRLVGLFTASFEGVTFADPGTRRFGPQMST